MVYNVMIWCTYMLWTEKAMAPDSSTLAWKIPWVEEPGRLQSMGSLRVGHDWATSLSLLPFMHWRRKWQPTPVFLPGESQGRGSLVGYCLWGRTESDTTEATQQQQSRLWFFLWSCMDVRVGLWRKLSTEELMLLNCGVGEDSWESLGLQGEPTSPF